MKAKPGVIYRHKNYSLYYVGLADGRLQPINWKKVEPRDFDPELFEEVL